MARILYSLKEAFPRRSALSDGCQWLFTNDFAFVPVQKEISGMIIARMPVTKNP